MNKKQSGKKDQKTKNKNHSLSAKTVQATIMSCIVFGFVAELVALSFYAYSFTRQYINIADSAARQARMSATHGADAVLISKQVMDVYKGLTPEQKMLCGTTEYREYFSGIDTGKGSNYSTLLHILTSTQNFSEVYDVYIAMYDRDECRIIYIVDSDPNPETRLMPGEWEEVNRQGMMKFLGSDGSKKLYDIDYTSKYGLLCTVAVPIEDETGKNISFMLVDISIGNVVHGMAGFFIRIFIAMIIVTIFLAYLQVSRMKKKLIEPINSIAEAAKDYVKNHNDPEDDKEYFASLKIETGDEIENLGLMMAQMEHELKDYEKNLTRITAEKERISTELSLATKIQASMIPHLFPPYPDRHEFEIFAMMEPAREVGGDFYDFFFIDPDHLCMVIADVSGKGIPAALFMMVSKIILQSCAMLGVSVAEILEKTNEAICSNNTTEMFVTGWLGVLEISTGVLTAANAGHEYPVIKRADGVFELHKDKHGFVIGGIEGTKYKEYTLEFKPGDKIFLYTDGVPEATDDKDRMFGTDRMTASLNNIAEASPEQIIKHVRADIEEFVNGAEQFDDITMMCLEYKGV